MRIIHCADLHLDAKMQTKLTIEEAKERRAEILDTFRRMLDFALEKDVDAILIAGDLFDREYSSLHTRSYVLELIASHPELEFYYLRGNHDQSAFCSGKETLPDNLHTFGRDWKTYQIGAEEGGRILLTAGEEADLRELFLPEQAFHIVMMHGQLADYPDQTRPEVIALSELKNKGIDYLALGHVHSFCQGDLFPKGRWAYSGCLEGRGFDECGEKGFLLLEINPKLQLQMKFIPFAKRRYLQLETEISGALGQLEIEEKIIEELRKEKAKREDLVKVILKGSLPLSCEKSLLQIRQRFQDSFYVFWLEDQSRLELDPLSYRKDASLKGELIRLVMADPSLSEMEKAGVIRCGLAALSGEEYRE